MPTSPKHAGRSRGASARQPSAMRLRGSRRTTDRAAARLVRHIVAGWRCQALHAAVQLGIPEALAPRPQSVAQLASGTGANEDGLARLLRGLCTLGVCEQRQDGRFALTRVGRRLCAEPPGGEASLRDLVRWWGGPLWPMWGELAYSVRTGASAREKLSGDVGYAHLMRSTEVAAIFHGAQQAMTALVQEELAMWPGWASVRRVVDLGGGHGQVALALARAHPNLEATVFDLPHAQAGAQAQRQAAGLEGRCSFVAGSFLDAVPANADVYLLKSILHNWDDARCRSILSRCADAAALHTRLLVIERVRPDRLTVNARDEGVARTDLNMLAGLGGRERTAAEYAALLGEAGFGITSVWPLGFEFTVLEACRTT